MPPAAWTNYSLLKKWGVLAAAAIWLSGCSSADTPPPPQPAKKAGPGALHLQAVSYARLPGWRGDSHDRAIAPFIRSCQKLLSRGSTHPLGSRLLKKGYAGRMQDWWPACRRAKALGSNLSPDNARRFFEKWFQPFIASDDGHRIGLFTGYFEPQLRGSRQRTQRYNVPLYRRPPDLIGLTAGSAAIASAFSSCPAWE